MLNTYSIKLLLLKHLKLQLLFTVTLTVTIKHLKLQLITVTFRIEIYFEKI